MTAAATLIPPSLKGTPLYHLKTVVSLCRTSDDGALHLVESGQIRFAYDLATNFNKPHLRYVMVLPLAVSDFLSGRVTELDPSDVPSVLFPDAVDTVRGVECHRIFNVGTNLFYRIVKSGDLKVSAYSTGPSGSPILKLSDIAAFLERRRIVPDQS